MMIRLSMIAYSLIMSCFFLASPSFAEDYERYKAVPLGIGGIFIIDTKEGHTWTWSNKGGTTVEGKSLSLEYQGNVRSNMKSKKTKKVDLKNDFHASPSGASKRKWRFIVLIFDYQVDFVFCNTFTMYFPTIVSLLCVNPCFYIWFFRINIKKHGIQVADDSICWYLATYKGYVLCKSMA